MITRPAAVLLAAAVVSATLCASPAAEAVADQPRPVMQCLPPSTIFAARVPKAGGVMQQLKTTTRFGALMLSDEKLARMAAAFSEHLPETRKELETELESLGLTFDDMWAMGTGEMGYAASVHPTDNPKFVAFIGTAWINPGEAIGSKYIEAIRMSIAKQAGEPNAATLETIKIAGHDVLHVRERRPYGDVFGFEAEGADADEGEAQAFGTEDSLIVQVGGRLIAVHTTPEEEDARPRDDLPLAKQVLTDLLAAMASKDTQPTIADRVMAAPGASAAMPAGETVAEAFVDLRPMWSVAFRQPDEQDKRTKVAMTESGVMDLSVMAVRWSLTDPGVRGGVFVAAPEPRRGLLAALDQKPVAAGAPDWVTADAIDYFHTSIDLGPMWSTMKQSVKAMDDEDADEFLEEVEFNVKAYAQTDLAGVLSGLGKRQAVVTYPPLAPSDPDKFNPSEFSRYAIVWELEDAKTWKTIVQGLAIVAMMSDGKIANDYDGEFIGYTSRMPEAQGALMHGHGYLMLSLGKGVAKPLMGRLAATPSKVTSLASTADYKRFMALLKPTDGLLFHFSRTGQSLDVLSNHLLSAMKQLFESVEEDEGPRTIRMIEQFMPQPEQLRGAVGVGGGVMYTTEHGLVGRSLLELPAADAAE